MFFHKSNIFDQTTKYRDIYICFYIKSHFLPTRVEIDFPNSENELNHITTPLLDSVAVFCMHFIDANNLWPHHHDANDIDYCFKI